MSEPSTAYGERRRGVTAADVERAADALFRAGERPTIQKVRAKLGTGSPNTINPLLDAWWKNASARLDTGPAALHRLPESVAHVAEALWMQALDEGRRRAHIELKAAEHVAADQKQAQDIRSHVLSLREGELDSRLRDRERTVNALEERLRELTLLFRKGESTRDAQARRILALEEQLLAKVRELKKPRPAIPRTPRRRTTKHVATKGRQVTRKKVAKKSKQATKSVSAGKGSANSRRR